MLLQPLSTWRKTFLCFIFGLLVFWPSSSRAFTGDQIYLQGLVEENGKVHFNQNSQFVQKPRQKVILGLESERIQVKIADSTGRYITNGQIILDLSAIKTHREPTLRTYAIHGILGTRETFAENKAYFSASGISENGIWTVEIVLPKGSLKPTLAQKILFWSANNSLIWFLVSLALIVLITSIIIYLLWHRYNLEKIPPSKEVLTAPPSDLSSAAVAILEEKHAAQRAIAAGILYLASRGFLTVVKTPNGFLVAKHKEPGEIAGIDREFYNLLIGNWFAQSTKEIKIETSRDLFNHAAGEIHRELYRELSSRGLFIGDPWLSYHKTRLVGIGLFGLSAISFFISLSVLPFPPFASLLWVALMMMSLVTLRIAGLMPLRSQIGVRERQAWHQFKKYLTAEVPVSEIELPMDIYLHYAISLGCEDEWIRRFASSNYRIPPWYVGPSVTVEDIATDIVEFVKEFSEIIDAGLPPEDD